MHFTKIKLVAVYIFTISVHIIVVSQGKAVITISHDMEYVAENFERVIVMAHKNVIADGKKEDIFYQRNELQEAYVKPPLSTQIAQEIGIKKKVLNMQELINCYTQYNSYCWPYFPLAGGGLFLTVKIPSYFVDTLSRT